MVLEDLLRRSWELTRYRRPPLGLELEGFCQWLHEQGYSRSVIRSHISKVSQFNQYLRYQGVRECREIQELHADRFIGKRLRKHGRVSSRHTAPAVRCLMKYLSSRGVLTSTAEIPPPYQGVLDEYVEYLRHDRALADCTIRIYRHYLIPFLQSLDGKHILRSLSEVSPHEVHAFFAKHAQGKADTTRGQIRATLRTFFAFCAKQGYVTGHLAEAVPKVFSYRLANVPRHLSEQDAQKLLESIDRSTPAGRRDYAMVLLLHTYGVRGAQIRALCLEDIQWRHSRIRFRPCKGGKEILDRYLTSLNRLHPNTRANRLSVVRQFCLYLRQFEPRCYVPEPGSRAGQRPSRTPHIFTDNEIKALLVVAHDLSPPGSLRPMTFSTLFGLLYTTGLRVGEAIALNLADVDLGQQRLYVHQSKFRKSRWVPISLSTSSVLQRYMQERTRIFPAAPQDPLFVNLQGRRFFRQIVYTAFRQALSRCGLRGGKGDPGPCLHDLRHSYACNRLVAWHRQGKNVNALLPALATYLGHVSITYTQVYLRATAELLEMANQRFHNNFLQNVLKKGELT